MVWCYFCHIDIVLRVIAAQLEPSNCSVVRVMTPHPDTAPSSMTIMDALRKMHGRSRAFIHLLRVKMIPNRR